MARTTKSQRREQKRIEAEPQRQKAARTKMIRTTAVGVVAVVVVVGLLFVVWPRKSDAEIAAEAASDTSATAWDLPELGGDGRVALADFRGKPTVAAFFASWCEVCESEMPELLALSEEVGEDINFAGIDMMEDGEVVHVQLGAISRSQILQELSPYLQG